jgi:hypothetical protein
MQKGRAVAPFTQLSMHGSPSGARNRLASSAGDQSSLSLASMFQLLAGATGGVNQGTQPQIIHAQRRRQPHALHRTRPLTTASSCARATTSYRYRYHDNAPPSAAVPWNLCARIHAALSAPSSRHDPISHAIARLGAPATPRTLSIASVFLLADSPRAYWLLRWAPLASIAPHLGLARLDSADTVKRTSEDCVHGGI